MNFLPLLTGCVARLDRWGHRSAENWKSWNDGFSRRMKPWSCGLEIIASVVLIAFASLYLFQIARVMVITPLQGDEVGTIKGFSSRGAKFVVTHYGVAKNHIFFNLLNAITPGNKEYIPWRGRLWSFIAFAALLITSLTFFFRRGWYLEGGLFFFFVTTSQKALETNLAGRGYGFLAFFTLVGCLLIYQFFAKPGWQPAAWLCVCTILGTYTMPHYILYGGVLIFLLFLWTWDWRVFLLGIATVVTIGLLYLPVFSQLTRVAEGYSDKYGESYPDFNAVFTTINYYLIQQKPWIIFAGLASVMVAPFALWPRGDSTAKALQVLASTSVLFFVICLEMETPRLRTTGFVIVPLIFVGLLAGGRLYRQPSLALLRPFLAIACTVPLAFGTWDQIGKFNYTPKENFLDSGKIVRSIFPSGVSIHVTERPDKLAHTLPSHYLRPLPFDPAAWSRGEMVMLDSDFRAEKRFVPTEIDPHAIELRVVQAKGGYQGVSLVPPVDDRIVWSQSGAELNLKIKNGPPLYSICIFVENSNPIARLQFTNEPTLAAKLLTFPATTGQLHVISGVGKAPAALQLRVDPNARVLNVWSIPAR